MNLIPRRFANWLQKKLTFPSVPLFAAGGQWMSWLVGGSDGDVHTGDWQANIKHTKEHLLSFTAVYSCMTLIASDISKLRIKLVKELKSGICEETTSAAFSPVLTKPNHYQNRIQFLTCWVISKLAWGNAYILKNRDSRGVVTELYALDPRYVFPLIAEDGGVYYQLGLDYLSKQTQPGLIVPASEIIHDIMIPLFHPLIGVSPLFASALPACTGLEIEKNQAKFFANGAKISGIITAPGAIGKEAAQEVKDKFASGYSGDDAGKIAVIGDGLKFQPLTMTSIDAQLIALLEISQLQVCSTFHVPAYKIGVGQMPLNNNVEALDQQYYSQCLQYLIESIELCLVEGLRLPSNLYAELDLDGLLRMDTAAQYDTYGKGVKGVILSPNDARQKLNLPPVDGGEFPIAQQQNFSLPALKKRDSLPNPFVIDRPVTNPTPDSGPGGTGSAVQEDPTAAGKAMATLRQKINRRIARESELYAAA
jgi:HK97 family phage portal protein